MKYFLFLLLSFTIQANEVNKYIQNLEKKNSIVYKNIVNSYGAYIPSVCYTKNKIEEKEDGNPCYACHRQTEIPNYHNNTYLQKSYDFPSSMLKNPYSNFFKDRTLAIEKISDKMILNYIKQSNYFNIKKEIILKKSLPPQWQGYRPDCYYNFDNEGFDHKPNGEYTLWRKFSYYPFLGTFFPSNGSMDDVLIRLEESFSKNEEGEFNIEIYKKNFQVIEELILRKKPLIEKKYWGLAEKKKFKIAYGLFPIDTEFLHSVRYIDWNEEQNIPIASKRMKELRYAKKIQWKSYAQLQKDAYREMLEAQQEQRTTPQLSFFRGNYQEGLKNKSGWVFQAFIEDQRGELRPQTDEELLSCMGCHSHLGVTKDSTFSFSRKFSWGEKSLKNRVEPKVDYHKRKNLYEYSFYLKENHSTHDFRDNKEKDNLFFDKNSHLKKSQIEKLHQDITLLLYPSKKRAFLLNKAYKVIVNEQSFIYGREGHIKKLKNVYEKVKKNQERDITEVIY